MPNAVLESFRAQRAEQISTMDSILAQVEGRDLVDAERGILEAARQRIAELDAQIKPLEEFEALRAAHSETVSTLPARMPAEPRRADGPERSTLYRSAGEFLVDLVRARGILERGVPDPQAAARIAQTRAVANQTTGDTAGILPTPIVGTVVNLIDANRPLITSLGGAKAMGGIPGTTFSRPKITQHTTVGVQAGEKTELPSQKMTIVQVPFTKSTYGGTVDISRQDIDWTSPSAWDILVRDLADVYAVQTETAVAAAFKTAAAGTAVSVGTAGQPITLAGWATGLYTAAMHSYQASKRMPDRIWCSLDVWAALGSMVDTQRVVLPPDMSSGATEAPIDSYDIGGSSLASFRGDLFGLPRIVVPYFASGTCVIGNSALYEVYEDVVGLLSVIEPSILGVQVAYGGYVAWGTLAGTGFVPLTIVGVLPTMSDDEQADAPAPAKNGK
jgi:HK97 family phage major capsid protein